VAMILLLCISIGAVLSTRWNVFVMFPVIGAALVIVAMVGVARGDSAGWLAVEMAVIIVCLELGYMARLVVYVLADAIRALTAIVVRPLGRQYNQITKARSGVPRIWGAVTDRKACNALIAATICSSDRPAT
jgi:hypothetical protein